MFRHRGKGRTYTHNLKLASILSGVAGIVNITGVLELHTLTTNVTGHFAFFSEELVLRNYKMAVAYLFYILFFCLVHSYQVLSWNGFQNTNRKFLMLYPYSSKYLYSWQLAFQHFYHLTNVLDFQFFYLPLCFSPWDYRMHW